jgi:hypothetical protein
VVLAVVLAVIAEVERNCRMEEERTDLEKFVNSVIPNDFREKTH